MYYRQQNSLIHVSWWCRRFLWKSWGNVCQSLGWSNGRGQSSPLEQKDLYKWCADTSLPTVSDGGSPNICTGESLAKNGCTGRSGRWSQKYCLLQKTALNILSSSLASSIETECCLSGALDKDGGLQALHVAPKLKGSKIYSGGGGGEIGHTQGLYFRKKRVFITDKINCITITVEVTSRDQVISPTTNWSMWIVTNLHQPLNTFLVSLCRLETAMRAARTA